jgi:ankyrin repeat protein
VRSFSGFKITPFHMAAQCGTIETIGLFSDCSDFDVNKADRNGATALHMAVHRGRPEIVSLILEFPGVDINAEDNQAVCFRFIGRHCTLQR